MWKLVVNTYIAIRRSVPGKQLRTNIKEANKTTLADDSTKSDINWKK